MTEKARVLEVHDNTATVVCYENGGCDSCNSMFCNPKARTFKAGIPGGSKVSAGDQVEVFVPPVTAIGSGFLVLIVPLILFVVSYLSFGFLDNEAAQVGTGLGGLVLGFVLVFLFGKRNIDSLPQITRVLEPDESIPVRPHPVNS